MTPPVTLVVSIDTEEDNWEPARSGVTVENIRELPQLHGTLQGLGLRPTYFTAYQVAIQPWAVDILRQIDASGAGEIGAHLHPWNTPPLDEEPTPRNTTLCRLPATLQVAKIATVTGALEQAIGRRPTSFRTGRWGFGTSTAAALIESGYRVDSSVTPFQSWTRYDDGVSHVGAPLDVYCLDGNGDPRVPVRDGPLVEVPVSAGYNRGSIQSWTRLHALLDGRHVRRLGLRSIASRLGWIRHATLNPELESVDDMLAVSRQLIDQGVRQLHMAWHSPSLRPGLTPFVVTQKDAARFYAVLATYVDRLAAITSLRCATVGEAARALVEAPPAPNAERRLVVISYYHPPDGEIGGMRWAGLTKYLKPHGWKSWVISAAPASGPTNESGAVAVAAPPRKTLNDLYRRWRLRWRHAKSAPAPSQGVTHEAGKGIGLLARLRLEIATLLWLPDEGRGWILRAAARARKVIRQVNPDVVVSTGPPHSAHLVAWLATRGSRVRWFADFRDPWAGPVTWAWRHNLVYRSHVSRIVTGWLERFVLSRASRVLCNTVEFTNAMRSLYPHATVNWLPNGVDRALLPRASDPLPGLGLVHVGTLYGGRDLRPVLRALHVLLQRHPELVRAGPALRVAGALEYAATRDAFRREVIALGLQDQVAELGVLPRADALQLAARARLALVLAQEQDLQVPGKLYELVAMGVPTLVIAGPRDAATSEARRIGAAAVEPDDCEGMARIMEQVCLQFMARPSKRDCTFDYPALAAQLDSTLQFGGFGTSLNT